MAVPLQRVATVALAAALADRRPVRREPLSSVRAVATGVVLGTVGRIAVKRVTALGRRLRAQPELDVESPSASRDDAMTRSEEELRVRTVRRESSRIRVRKYIVTEEVQRTIPVRREEICIEEEPAPEENADTADADGAAVSTASDGESYEIVLYEEVPVIEMRVVPRERVRIQKETRREVAEVVETLRAERIDVERDEAPTRQLFADPGRVDRRG
jgi:uncharacterized protein (TIGR02271 family)